MPTTMSYKFNLAPKSLDEQSAAFKKLHTDVDALRSEDYFMQPKYDGCLAIIICDPAAPRIITRTGEPVTSMPHILEASMAMCPGQVLFGEAYRWKTPFKDIGGMFRRHAPQPGLYCVLFDAVPLEDWVRGECDKPYKARLSDLQRRVWSAYPPGIIVAATSDLDGPRGFAAALVLDGGYDGVIVRRKDAPWMTGPSKNGEAIKVKPVQSLDLKCTGWFAGKGKHALRAGGITVEHRGVSTEVGTGFTDTERETIISGCYDGTTAEIEFMEITAAGKLREPRFKGWRFDKAVPDA